ncbi:leucine-rich repeat protein [Petrocella sp. FN5]|uniref:leucine-rich repeat protein n=1 Tax=Petrocella sp. FN5 TaxID=3032002 RepID=UPI0023D9971B|nr:leucine-rich repeat protein [Petrocella sp. FN5]MDF1618010.1 leucine-rich repeat protein [Petrocella sp. FN5]
MKKLLTINKQRIISLFLVLLLILTPLTNTFAAQVNDVTNHWGEEVISEWLSKDLSNGYPNGSFKPDNLITRAEFMTLTNKAFGFVEEEMIEFHDVSENAWYTKAIKIAKAVGYIEGYPDRTMKPNNAITRQEAAIIISKIKGLESNPSHANIFADAQGMLAWSKGQIGAVAEAGYMSGYPDESFKPEKPITRAEALISLDRALYDGTWIIKEVGTYGPKEGTDLYDGDVIIKADGSILQNITITGDLIITEEVGEGEVTLNNVRVEGDTYIQGGGTDSIYINGGSYGNILIQRTPSGAVRVVVTGQNRLSVEVDEEAEEQIVILDGFYDKVIITAPNVRIITRGETQINELLITGAAKKTTLETSEDTIIEKAKVDGDGTIFEGGSSTVKKVEGSERNSLLDKNQVVISVPSSGSSGSSTPAPGSQPESTTSAAYFMFDSVTGTITKYFSKGQSGDLPEILHPVIPALLGDNIPVKIIGESAFDFGTVDNPNELIPNKLIGVTLPSSLEHIEDYAFRSNTLSTLIMPDGIASIGREAFRGNDLTTLVIPNSLVTLGRSAFRNNSIQALTLSNSLESIGQDAFRSNQLMLLSIPSNVKTIEEAAFRENLLTAVELSQGLEVIGQDAFKNNLLESIIIPDGVTTIEEGAFHTNKLSYIDIPESVISIGNNVFYLNEFTEIPQLPYGITSIPRAMFGENKFTQISIPDHITRIEENAFSQNQITAIIAADLNNVAYIGDMAFDNNQISSLEFNSTLEEIGHQAFSHNLLSDLAIPASLKIVNTTAFWENDLISISIGDEVEIKDYALHRNQLTTITIGTNVTLGDNLLAGLFGDPINNRFRDAYQANGAGTYTGTQTGNWTKVETPPEPSDSFTVAEGSTHNGVVAEGSPTYTLVTGPEYGMLIINADGTFSYMAHRQPTLGFVSNDTFVYQSSQGINYTVSITITPVNDAPVAIDSAFTVTIGENHSSSVTATDVDGDAMTFILVEAPVHGTLILYADGTYTYTATSGNEANTDTFTYKANDGLADSNTATVMITRTSND